MKNKMNLPLWQSVVAWLAAVALFVLANRCGASRSSFAFNNQGNERWGRKSLKAVLTFLSVMLVGMVFAMPSFASAQSCSNFVDCAHRGNAAEVKRYISEGVNTEQKNSGGRAALHYAARDGYTEIVTILLSAAANINVPDSLGYRPLHLAVRSGHIKIVSVLISARANVNAVSYRNGRVDGQSILSHAVGRTNNKVIISMLLAAGATPSTAGHCYPVDKIFKNNQCESCPANQDRHDNRCVTTQLSCNANNQIFVGGNCRSCASNEIRNGNSCIVCNSGSEPIQGNTCEPTMAVCHAKNQILNNGSCQSCPTGQMRLANTCRVTQLSCNVKNQIFVNGSCQSCSNGQTRSGNSCVASAQSCSNFINCAYRGNAAEVKRYISEGVNTEQKDVGGRTALHYAARDGYTEIVTILLSATTNINVPDSLGYRPLHGAVRSGHIEIVSVLISARANVNAVSYRNGRVDGQSILSHAVGRTNNKVIISMLLAAGATPSTAGHCYPVDKIFKNNQCESCPANQDRHDNRCVTTQLSCNANNQIFVGGNCRSCASNEIRNGNSCAVCNPGTEPVQGNTCQPTMAVCHAKNQILNNGRCQPCSTGQVRDGNTCGATTALCNANNQIFINGGCQSCSAGQAPNGNICETTMTSCNANNQIFVNGSCQSCPAGQVRNSNICETTMASCNANNQIFVNSNCQSCSTGQVRNGNTCEATMESCRAKQQNFANGRCVDTVASCNANGQIFDGARCIHCLPGQELSGNTCKNTISSCRLRGQIYQDIAGTCGVCPSLQEPSPAGNSCVPSALWIVLNGRFNDLVALVKEFIDGGANVNYQNADGRTPLMVAAQKGDVAVASQFIEATANVNVADNNGRTPLMHAIVGESSSATSNAVSSQSLTPASVPAVATVPSAVSNTRLAMVTLLVGQGANINTRDNAGKTALDLAQENNRAEVVAFLSTINVPTSPASSGGGGGGGGGAGVFIGVGVVALAGLYFFTSDDVVSSYHFSPYYSYNLTDDGYDYRVGSRLDYQADNWNLHWAVGADDSSNDFRYATGIEYNGDFWNAAFSEEIDGDVVDYRFSLSGELDAGTWQLLPSYSLHSRFADFSTKWESDTNNSLNLEGVWHYSQWTIKPSAGFQWQNEFGDNAKFNVLATWEF